MFIVLILAGGMWIVVTIELIKYFLFHGNQYRLTVPGAQILLNHHKELEDVFIDVGGKAGVDDAAAEGDTLDVTKKVTNKGYADWVRTFPEQAVQGLDVESD